MDRERERGGKKWKETKRGDRNKTSHCQYAVFPRFVKITH
jgi:hypothetical protein